MSGIAGFYELARPAEFGLIERMTKIMAHRGPDGDDHWQNNRVALGHCSLITTPEAQHETLPLHSAPCGLTLTCDARLDNRDELLAQLTDELERLQVLAEPLKAENVGDGALILAAYMRWGEGCAEQLLGDFAFAIWDENKQRLFCARDHVGVKPFYYHHAAGEHFVFASEIKAIFQMPQVSRARNEKRIAEYLLFAFSDHESTFYSQVRRLPAAHTLTVSRSEFRLQRYWNLSETPMQHGLSDAEADARFREILYEAVRCRLRGRAGEVGGFLSGGLDSSSLMCVAREVKREQTLAGEQSEPLPVFSTIYDEVPECDERQWINNVLDMGGLKPNWIKGESRSALMDLEEIQWFVDEPLLAPNLCSGWAQYQRASEQGVRVLLDGHGGDEVIGSGYNRLNELARAKQWKTLWRELRLLERNGFWGDDGVSANAMMRLYLAALWTPARLTRRVVAAIARRLNRNEKRHASAQNVGSAIDTKIAEGDEIINADFARRIDAASLHEAWEREQPRPNCGDRETNERVLATALQTMALETLDKAAAASGVEARYPLWDKRLVEFCLALPAQHRLRDGWSRLIIRRALENVLPPEVQWRTSKNNFMGELRRGLRVYETKRLRALAHDESSLLKDYVDKAKLNSFIEKTLGDEPHKTCHAHDVLRAACFQAWLLKTETETDDENRKQSYHKNNQPAVREGDSLDEISTLKLAKNVFSEHR